MEQFKYKMPYVNRESKRGFVNEVIRGSKHLESIINDMYEYMTDYNHISYKKIYVILKKGYTEMCEKLNRQFRFAECNPDYFEYLFKPIESDINQNLITKLNTKIRELIFNM